MSETKSGATESASSGQLSGSPMRPSEEGDERGLELARAQGDAFRRTIEHMANRIAERGGMQVCGDYLVAFAVEKAEGMYHMEGGRPVWRKPDGENAHIEVAVCGAADQRFIPYASVTATIEDASGRQIEKAELPFLWHPYLYHYGKNVKLPGSGTYRLRVHVEPPQFARHDEVNGRHFVTAADADFPGVRIEVGSD